MVLHWDNDGITIVRILQEIYESVQNKTPTLSVFPLVSLCLPGSLYISVSILLSVYF